MITVSRTEIPANIRDGMRPINLATDLAPLADLIELVFADSMDGSGRAALREMRYMSKVGAGLRLLSQVNDIALGVSLGYVWVADSQLVGNVSIYPANWPRDLGTAWIVANVGVHPDYQRRGIARKLMQASMEMIRQRGGQHAILQVDADNYAARHLYNTLGFIDERSWTTWQRSGSARTLASQPETDLYVRSRRRGEWRAEMALAQLIRPHSKGGLGWLRPLHTSQFRTPVWRKLVDWLNLSSLERLVVHSRQDSRLLGSLWIENSFAGKTRLTLLVDPEHDEAAADLLIGSAARRTARNTLVIEHPTDEKNIGFILGRYRFIRQREVVHMRWDVR